MTFELKKGDLRAVAQTKGGELVSFRDGDGTKYDEHIYDISFEELSGCTLTGEFTTGGYLLDGDWKVTFMLED